MKKSIAILSLAVVATSVVSLPAHASGHAWQQKIIPRGNAHPWQKQVPPRAVMDIDLDKYKGKWYEIARKPAIFQIECYKNVTATYELQSEGKIKVTNECKNYFNRNIVSVGRAKTGESNGQLRVDFIPKELEWLQTDKSSNYWVLAIDNDYRHVMVGTPSRKYLWILSRTKKIPTNVYDSYRSIAMDQGYDIKNLKPTRQY